MMKAPTFKGFKQYMYYNYSHDDLFEIILDDLRGYVEPTNALNVQITTIVIIHCTRKCPNNRKCHNIAPANVQITTNVISCQNDHIVPNFALKSLIIIIFCC